MHKSSYKSSRNFVFSRNLSVVQLRAGHFVKYFLNSSARKHAQCQSLFSMWQTLGIFRSLGVLGLKVPLFASVKKKLFFEENLVEKLKKRRIRKIKRLLKLLICPINCI